jgi:RNA polymerase sigma-70 factor, ECF subfamily
VTEAPGPDHFPAVLAIVEQPPARSPQGERFERLYESEKSFVWNLMFRFGVPTQDREDVFQEVFLRAFRQPLPPSEASPRPWLMGIAFRVASEWRRLRRKHEVAEQEPGELKGTAPSPEQRYSAHQDLELLERALQQIELERRAIFIAYEMEEIPVPEIAASMGVPLNTAYSRLRLARQEFAEAVRRLQAKGAGQ